MPYTKNYPTGWKNRPDLSTPISAETLDHIEEGIATAQAAAEAAQEAADTAQDTADEHVHDAAEITTGVLDPDRVPTLDMAKVDGLTAALGSKVDDIEVQPEVGPDVIPRRDENGQIMVPTVPTADGHAASKAYADTKMVGLNGLAAVWRGTQAEYDLLTPDPDTLYFVVEEA